MRTNIEHPLAVAYLETVAREAASWTPERRDELLADLTEHIEVALAERPAADDAEVKAVLERLGDPRTIVTTAQDGEAAAPPPADKDRRRALAPLIVPAAGLALIGNVILGLIAVIVGVVLVWKAPQWSGRDKAIALATALLIPVCAAVAVLNAGFSPWALLGYLAAVTLFPAAASLYLFRISRRPLAS